MLNVQWFHFGLVQKQSRHHWIMLLSIRILLLCGEMIGNGTTVVWNSSQMKKWCNEITAHCQTCCLQMGFAMEMVVSVECLWCCQQNTVRPHLSAKNWKKFRSLQLDELSELRPISHRDFRQKRQKGQKRHGRLFTENPPVLNHGRLFWKFSIRFGFLHLEGSIILWFFLLPARIFCSLQIEEKTLFCT